MAAEVKPLPDPGTLDMFGRDRLAASVPYGEQDGMESPRESTNVVPSVASFLPGGTAEATQNEEIEQPALFEIGEPWENDWQGMPEFVQEDLTPYKTVYVHFADRADMDNFSRLLGQKLTFDTKSIWYPRAEIGRMMNKRFVDES